MRQIYYLLLITALVSTKRVSAQSITLSNNDVAKAGTTLYYAKDTAQTNAVTQQSLKSGSMQTWDFSGLQVQKIDTMTFMKVSSGSQAALFSNANVCVKSSELDWEFYLSSTNQKLAIEGVYGDVANVGQKVTIKTVNDPQVVLNFPTTYQDATTSNNVSMGTVYYGKYEYYQGNAFWVDSLKAVQTTNTTSIIDGYGKLTLPNNSYDVLKQNVKEEKTIDYYGYVFPLGWVKYDSLYQTAYHFRWWANNVGAAVAECEYMPSTNTTKSFSYFYASYQEPYAAITVTENDLNSTSIDNLLIFANDASLDNVTMNNALQSGTALTWDFTNVSHDSYDTLSFYNPLYTAMGSYFSQSNMCSVSSNDNWYYYFTVANDKLTLDGVYGDVANIGSKSVVTASPSQTVLTLPSTYNTAFTDTSYAELKQSYSAYINPFTIDSIWVQQTTITESKMDGAGSLQLPNYTADAIKQDIKLTKQFTYWGYVQGLGWIPYDAYVSTQIFYRWWVNGMSVPVVQCEYLPSNNTVKSFSYYYGDAVVVVVVTAIDNVNAKNNNALVYPNPANDYLSISNTTYPSQIDMYNTLGACVKKQIINFAGEKVNIAGLSQGSYIYKLSSNGEMKSNGIINVQ